MFPHNDLLMVLALVGNRTVHRILVYNMSAIDILFGETFNMMVLKKESMSPSPKSLYGFTEDLIEPKRNDLGPYHIWGASVNQKHPHQVGGSPRQVILKCNH